ncbi:MULTISPECIES: hypothetical protein, partial [unclassified Bradyrhizobium]|uniref:hypothetical protein n=1 Tax=unclassified Bradyrhizobium TaxID=2631580 RepID=UPI001FF8A319
HMVKLRHKPISTQRSIIPRSTRSMEGGTETALTIEVAVGDVFFEIVSSPVASSPSTSTMFN